MAGSGKYDQEVKIAAIFQELRDGFKKADGISDIGKQQAILKDFTGKMQEVKA